MRIGSSLLPALLAFSPVAASAQTIVGVVVEAETERPIVGAFVSLLDAGGQARRGALTDAVGRFTFRLDSPGRYGLRVEQIGRRTTTVAPFLVGDGETVSHTVRAAPEAISLEAIEVSGEQRCRLRPDVGEATARLWEEARKALEIARWVDDNAALEYRLLQFRREVDAESGRVLDEQSTVRTGFSDGSPFVSTAPDSLARFGYIWRVEGGDMLFHAPDAHVLLSDGFVDRHCFRVRLEGAPEPGLIGLAFEPVERRDVTDVEGVLWLERATAELRFLEYRYDRLPYNLQTDRVGGTLVFERLPGGPFVVRRWEIRMPTVAARRVSFADSRQLRYVLEALMIEGGEILAARTPAGGLVLTAELATLAGTVHDSVAGAPLAGATIRLEGTRYFARTHDTGAFIIAGAPAGSYAVVATSPRLDSLGIAELRGVAELRGGEITTLALATPSRPTLLARPCVVEGEDAGRTITGRPGYGAIQDGGGVLVGFVRSAGTALPGALVEVSWTVQDLGRAGQAVAVESASRVVETSADGSGRWRACGLPPDIELEVRAEAFGRRSEPVTVRLDADEIRLLELTVPDP
ncbi:MAG: carboxypeptidase regulatory-like domain-containing protein [Longimicrobiales bacterium]